MFNGRRLPLLGMGAAAIWYVCILVFWASQSMTDSVPVGVDYTLKTPAAVSVAVQCNSMFDGSPRDSSALPALNVQPVPKPRLAFQRQPCGIVHDQARTLLAIDTALFVAVVGFFAWLALRRRQSSSSNRQTSDPRFVGSAVG